MQFQTYTDPHEFLKCAQPVLEAKESLNSSILGNAIRLINQPGLTDAPPFLATIEEAGATLLIAIQAPPHYLLLSSPESVPEEAIDLLVKHLHSESWQYPGVLAPGPLATRFAEGWQLITGQAYQLIMRQRLYELRQVIFPPNPPPGRMRLATLADLDRIIPWRVAFDKESLHEVSPPNMPKRIELQIQAGNIFLWETDQPVSMAARARPTPHGYTVNSVYTPPEHRGHGYASALVATLSQRLLDSGKQFCNLFTDLDFPTSNAIYKKIGYFPVADFLEYRFH